MYYLDQRMHLIQLQNIAIWGKLVVQIHVIINWTSLNSISSTPELSDVDMLVGRNDNEGKEEDETKSKHKKNKLKKTHKHKKKDEKHLK